LFQLKDWLISFDDLNFGKSKFIAFAFSFGDIAFSIAFALSATTSFEKTLSTAF